MKNENLHRAIVRLGALTIDFFASAVPLLLIMAITNSALAAAAGGLAFVVLFLQRNWGWSPGCAFTGVRLQSGKNRQISLMASVLRNLTLLIPMVIFFEGAMVVFRDRGERLGDLLAETRVECDPSAAGRSLSAVLVLSLTGTIAAMIYFGHHMSILHPSEFK